MAGADFMAAHEVRPGGGCESARAMSVDVRRMDAAAEATAAAEAAARSAGLTITEIDDLAELGRSVRLIDEVWSNSAEEPLISVSTLKALAHAGSYVAAAYNSGDLVGALVGFIGFHGPEVRLHSHILGVSPRLQGRNIGFALKLHQRAWALAHGIATVVWTFDPLVRRNAFFNVSKLGASITAYYEDFYGTMRDGINAGDFSDRVLVEWSLTSPAVVERSNGHAADPDSETLRRDGAAVVLEAGADGEPLASDARGAGTLLLQLPDDIVALRGRDPDAARRWRLAVRETLGAALRDGFVANGVARAGWYVLGRR